MTFFRYFWNAIGGFRTYRIFLPLSFRQTLFYWVVFTALLTSIFIANLLYFISIGLPAIQRHMSRVPEFSITNGVASSSLPQPYFANTNDFPIIQDFNNNITEPQKLFSQGILFRKTEVLFWLEGSGKPQPLAFQKTLPNGVVNAAYLSRLKAMIPSALPFLFFVFWLGFILMGLLQGLFATMFIGLLERSMNPQFSFSQVFNISIFALTPGCVLISVWASLGFMELPYPIVYFTCYSLFLLMATSLCRIELIPPSQRPEKEEAD